MELTPEVATALKFLKTCTDYTTTLAYSALDTIIKEVEITDRQKKQKKLTYLVSEGYGQLLTTMLNALSGYLEKEKWGESGFDNLKLLILAYVTSSDCCPDFCAELGNSGSISLLFASLSKLEAYLDEDLGTIQTFLQSILLTLYHSIFLCQENLKIYREAHAFAILEKYMRKKDLTSHCAFLVLAYVVDESQREILGTFETTIYVIVHFLQEAVGSFGHIVSIFQSLFSARKLLDCLNRLAINDNNKRLIEEYYGIPAIVAMLGDDFDEEDQCLAAETVWNLAFVEDIRKSPQLQEAVPCK